METQQKASESEKIVGEVARRKQELETKAEYSKEMAKHMSSGKVVLGTILASMVAGAMVGEAEVLIHGAEAAMPAVVGTCGALGGAIASGIAAAATKAQAKIDQQNLERAK